MINNNVQPPLEADIAIRVDNVGKMYKLFDKPVDRLKHTLFWRFGKVYGEDFWALRNISFEVKKGEALGIVGRNGSGKSTLLQIITGVLPPTTGTVETNGRITALLELGSGFNPEYTGKENVYMSGAILGLSPEEVNEKYEDILSFADIGSFIEQPVKLYSSGMFARLAFAVAVSFDPDILIVDEILAVGDYSFQQKCVARMAQMRDNGLTLVYVSHSTDSIKDVCSRAIYLKKGELVYQGTSEQTTDLYLKDLREASNEEINQSNAKKQESTADTSSSTLKNSLRYGTGFARVEKVEVRNDAGEICGAFEFGEHINIDVQFRAYRDISNVSVGYGVRDNSGITVIGTTLFDENIIIPEMKEGEEGFVRFRLINHLRHGNYGVNIGINSVSKKDYSDNLVLDLVHACATFLVVHNPKRPVWYKCYVPIDIEYRIGNYAGVEKR